ALDNSSLVVLDTRTLPAFISKSSGAIFNAIQTSGFQNEQDGLDYGEAYTFAAGVILDVPVISNDRNAILVARAKRIPLPRQIIRMYDLIVLCQQCGELTVKDCDEIRTTLNSKGEFIP